jgi:hypothetical protein
MSHVIEFSELSAIATEAFSTLSFYRRHYSSGDEFQTEFKRVVGVLRDRAQNLGAPAQHNALFFDGIADALELWNYGNVRTRRIQPQ